MKTNEARSFSIHAHLVGRRFVDFVAKTPDGHLFLRPGDDGDMLGPLQGVKNRLGELTRKAIGDAKAAPSHGWWHRFKTIGLQAGIDHRILDAIQGHAPKTQGETYGDVTMKTMVALWRRCRGTKRNDAESKEADRSPPRFGGMKPC